MLHDPLLTTPAGLGQMLPASCGTPVDPAKPHSTAAAQTPLLAGGGHLPVSAIQGAFLFTAPQTQHREVSGGF